MTVRPMGSIGCRIVVRGGSVQFISAESSKPTMDTSRGTESPARRAAWDEPERARGKGTPPGERTPDKR